MEVRVKHDDLKLIAEYLFGHLSKSLVTKAGVNQSIEKLGSNHPDRLAYTMQETAVFLGVSYESVYRLVKRGLLKPSLALRKVIIARKEIERFLEETSSSDI